MGAVKSMMMDVEDFVYDFYSSDGELMESPKVIIEKAIEKFGWSFGEYDMRQAEAEYHAELASINNNIPF